MSGLVARPVCRSHVKRHVLLFAKSPTFSTVTRLHGSLTALRGVSNSNGTSSSSAAHMQLRWAHSTPAAVTTLGTLQRYVQQRDEEGCAAYYESHFNPSQQHFVNDFCRGYAADARDAALLLMRIYTNRGRINKVREVLSVAMRDLAAADVPLSVSPLCYAQLAGRGNRASPQSATPATSPSSHSSTLTLSGDLLAAATNGAPSSSPSSAAAHFPSSSPTTVTSTWHRPSLLNASIFNAYLEALTRRNKFAVAEVTFLLEQMAAAGVARDALTYHFLIELHVRAGYDPTGLWTEMHAMDPPLAPLPATVLTLLLRVVPSSNDPAFVVDVTKAALRCGTAVMDKRMLAEMAEQWLHGVARSLTSNSNSGGEAAATSAQQQSSGASASALTASVGSGGNPAHYPPEYVLWLLLELELRCVLEKASFTQYVQRHHLTELLLKCAKCTDAGTAEQVLALMDRHALPKTADILALVVWCWSQALEIEKTLDLIEWMALKGYLDQVDCFRKAHIDSLRYTMDQHYLMAFADALSTPALTERALAHLQARRQRGEMVTAHTLDLVVLALAKVGEERRALHLVSTFEPRWGISPRTNTFNSLLVGCSRHRSTMLHRVVYKALVNSGVVANVFTFRVLIRQAVVSGNVDEALFYLEEVTRHPGLRVEVEMILPILERAARVGDVATANRVSQFSLKYDIGIDGGVLRSVMQQLTEAGQSVEVLKGQLPLHEALRSRSKTGRQRARNEVLL